MKTKVRSNPLIVSSQEGSLEALMLLNLLGTPAPDVPTVDEVNALLERMAFTLETAAHMLGVSDASKEHLLKLAKEARDVLARLQPKEIELEVG